MTDRQDFTPDEEVDAQLGEALRQALAAHPIAPERLEPMRTAVAQEWRAANPVRRAPWVAAIATAAGFSVLFIAAIAIRPARDVSVIGAVSKVTARGVTVRHGWFGHRLLRAGDRLRTGDALSANGSALIKFVRGGDLRIAAGSALDIAAPTRLLLRSGLIYVDLPLGPRSNPIVISTSRGAIEHLGTEFEVESVDRKIVVRVRQGRIRFSTPARAMIADAGSELLVAPDGKMSLHAADMSVTTWQWADALAPDYPINGRPLIGYLRWAGRELGCRLEFADARTRAIADGTIMHGSVNGEAPLVGLARVLATTSLSFEVEGRVLRLRSSP